MLIQEQIEIFAENQLENNEPVIQKIRSGIEFRANLKEFGPLDDTSEEKHDKKETDSRDLSFKTKKNDEEADSNKTGKDNKKER